MVGVIAYAKPFGILFCLFTSRLIILTKVIRVAGTQDYLVTKSIVVLGLSFLEATRTMIRTVTHINSDMQSKSRDTLTVRTSNAAKVHKPMRQSVTVLTETLNVYNKVIIFNKFIQGLAK